ncbi:ABC transporter ATP-binding protein [bacterium]|nr:ABC transporter ATP-binding protein [bacterium]
MWWHLDETDSGVRQQSVRELLPKILPLFYPHRRFLFAAYGLLIVITGCFLAGPLIIQHIIDNFLNSEDPAVLAVPVPERVHGLIVAGVIYAVVAIVLASVGYLQGITLFRLGINIVTDLKSRLFNHVLHLGLDFHEEQSPGKLISRVESDTETLKELFSDVTVNLLRNLMFFIGILVMMLVKNFSIGVWILLLVPVLFAAAFWFINFMRKYWREWRVQWAVIMGYVTEYMQGIDVIQQFNYQKRSRERMFETSMGKYRVEVPSSFLDYGFWGAFLFGEIIAMIIVLIVGINGAIAETVKIGTVVMFFLYIQQMFQPIMQLSEQLNFIQRSLISVERVLGILETKPSVDDGAKPAVELAFDHEIKFENVWFAYKKKATESADADASETPAAPDAEDEWEWVLKDVSFTIPKGYNIALVGASGGGKSTIVNLLLRFYDPQRGRILVDGRDIRDYPVKAWRSHSGLVLQDVYLFPGSVADNLRVFNETVDLKLVENAAAITRADKIIENLPDGYQGELAERGANLSVGERQLLSFARALAQNPPLLVLDEATSSVDPHTERLVQEALEKLLEGRTGVIVAHRLSTILNSNLILLIHQGRIAESGNHQELLAKNGLYAKLFRLQFAGNSEDAA